MNPLNDVQSSSSSSLNDDSGSIEPTLPVLHNNNDIDNSNATGIAMHPQQVEPQSPPRQQEPDNNYGHRRMAQVAVVSFNDHVEVQHYDPLPEYNDDDSGECFFHDASDVLMMMHDEDSDSETHDSRNDGCNGNRTIGGLHHINNSSTENIDWFGLQTPMVDTSVLLPTSFYHLGGGIGGGDDDDDTPLGQQQEQLFGMGRSHSRRRPLHHFQHMNENLQGYTDLTDFATLTDSSNSDSDSNSDYLGSLSQGLTPSQTHLPQERHSNLAEQLLLSSSSSNIPPLEGINIIVDELDMPSSSGSVVSDLNSHLHFVDPNLYPMQQHYRVGNDDDQEYYFEVQSLDSCFLPPQTLYDDNNNNLSVRPNRHPHYRLSILKQRLRESKMADALSLIQFRRNSKNSSPEDTDTELSYSNNNDIIVHAEPILLP